MPKWTCFLSWCHAQVVGRHVLHVFISGFDSMRQTSLTNSAKHQLTCLKRVITQIDLLIYAASTQAVSAYLQYFPCFSFFCLQRPLITDHFHFTPHGFRWQLVGIFSAYRRRYCSVLIWNGDKPWICCHQFVVLHWISWPPHCKSSVLKSQLTRLLIN